MHLNYVSVQDQEKILGFTQEQFALAAAIAAGNAVPIPGQAVEDPKSFIAAASDTIKEIVGILNEVRPINTTDAIDLAINVWLGRYATAHSSLMEKADRVMSICGGVFAVTGFSFYLSGAQSKAIEDNQQAVTQLLPITFKAAGAITSVSKE